MVQKVKDIMTKMPVQVRPQTAVADVAKLMRRQDVGARHRTMWSEPSS